MTESRARSPDARGSVMSPADLREMTEAGLVELAGIIRRRIVEICARNGGHLGASLGAVEIAIALHAVFQSPSDPIIWDVGHQAYAHKLITGRWDSWDSLRLAGGLSGFLSRNESEHDVFGAGHSSTSLSAALAMAWAAGRAEIGTGKPAPWTVAVIGDGGLTAGLAFEALNNIRETPRGPLLVVLNDNQMSISRNAGAIPGILSGGGAREFFSQFGFIYSGPADGHDLPELIRRMRQIHADRRGEPVLLHLITTKGKGHDAAERLPAAYHGVSPGREKALGSLEREAPAGRMQFSDAAGKALEDLAGKDPRIVAVSAAMVESAGLSGFSSRFPDRIFDVGIAEAHAVTFAAGLAASGYRPAACIYSTFLQRALDSIIHDVALQSLPVALLVDRAGAVGADGPTHHGAFDLVYLSMIPNLRVSAPASLSDLRLLLNQALGQDRAGGPWAIRYPRGPGPEELAPALDSDGLRWHQLAASPELIAVAVGAVAGRLAAAARAVDPESKRITVVSSIHVKPIPGGLIDYLARYPGSSLLTAEEGVVRGGFGSALWTEATRGRARGGRVEVAGYGDHFIPQGSPSAQEEWEGLSESALVARLKKLLSS